MGFHSVCVMYARGSSKNVGIGILCNLNGLSLISLLRPDGFKSINDVESSSLLIKVRGRCSLSLFPFIMRVIQLAFEVGRGEVQSMLQSIKYVCRVEGFT